MGTEQCPWLDPIMGPCNHKDHKIRVQREVRCQCLVDTSVPRVMVDKLRNGKTYIHLGTEECCSAFCQECGLRACFGCGCEAYDYDRDDLELDFADPGGRSSLRAATGDYCVSHGCHKKVGRKDHYCKHCGGKLNPRCNPCPTCKARDVLTDEDVSLGYQCDDCADRLEQGEW